MRKETIIFLADTPSEKVFWCSNGNRIKNLKELERELKKMDEEIFGHHVNEEKNDFSNWIYDVIGDIELAENIREIKDKSEIAKKVKNRIAQHKRKTKTSKKKKATKKTSKKKTKRGK